MNITQTTTRFYTGTMQNQDAKKAAGNADKSRLPAYEQRCCEFASFVENNSLHNLPEMV